MIKDGLLSRYGKPTEATPKDWQKTYKDYRFAVCDVKCTVINAIDGVHRTTIQQRPLSIPLNLVVFIPGLRLLTSCLCDPDVVIGGEYLYDWVPSWYHPELCAVFVHDDIVIISNIIII